ncbi:outer membrane protein assembly factor BamD [Paraneptunicella aestuarii]|uniref:outer membrane protein assembly factor BamD n=1 Tax=Paraneptunicella aestuarii TaxID=2831148 RepID=UPI001E611DE7|nr:outer membrane protein assembly factor BamD [Paraneptunicella aestuarii]UAA39957.1 outer membrane protein assembly factor BamD [Paraneptunicella aestuarii]
MNTISLLRLLPILIILPILTACSSSPDDEDIVIANKGAEALYEDAKRSMEVGNFSQAAATLSALDSRYPFGPLSHQVQLDLIYAYYKSNKTDECLATIDRFIRLNPNHSDVDYAIYMRGLVNMGSDSNFFQDIVGIDRSDRDATQARQAFNDFKGLIEKYPNSRYAADSRKRMGHIKNRLAKYELAVARYYMKRDAYVAAANRGQYVVEQFSDTGHVQEALEIMVECYEQMGLQDLKNNALQTLRLNFPESSYVN